MKTICRVPLQVLSLRLSILYLRTCVGLGYGRKCILFLIPIKFCKNNNCIKMFCIKLIRPKHWLRILRGRYHFRRFTLKPKNPFVFGEKYYNFFLRYSCQHYLFRDVIVMKHYSSTVLNVPLSVFMIYS